MIGDIQQELAGSDFKSASGSGSASVTVEAGYILTSWWMISGSADPCTMTMSTAKGPSGDLGAQPTFTLPAGGVSYGEVFTGQLVAGTVLAFVDAESYRCTFAKPRRATT